MRGGPEIAHQGARRAGAIPPPAGGALLAKALRFHTFQGSYWRTSLMVDFIESCDCRDKPVDLREAPRRDTKGANTLATRFLAVAPGQYDAAAAKACEPILEHRPDPL